MNTLDSPLSSSLSSSPSRVATPELRRLRLLAWSCPLAVVVGAIVWNVGAGALDASPLEQEPNSWGFMFATAIYTFMVGVPLLVLTTIVALFSQFVASAARGGLVTGVLLCALTGFAMGVLGLVVAAEGGNNSGDLAFGLLTFVTALILMVPGWFAWDTVARR